MALSSKAVKDFIRAYSLDFGVELSEKEARAKAEELIGFTMVIARTAPQLEEKRDTV